MLWIPRNGKIADSLTKRDLANYKFLNQMLVSWTLLDVIKSKNIKIEFILQVESFSDKAR